MGNEILDVENEIDESSSIRKYLLLFESTLIVIFTYSFLSSRFANSSPELDGLLLISGFMLILLYLFSPVFRFLKKESNGKIAFLYFIQNIFLLSFILGSLFKFESWPHGTEFMFIGYIGFIFLNIIPHFELRRINSHKQLHYISALINFGVLVSIMSLIFRLESWQFSFELGLIGFFLCLISLIITFLFYVSNQKKFTSIGFYIPRLLLALYFTLPSFFM